MPEKPGTVMGYKVVATVPDGDRHGEMFQDSQGTWWIRYTNFEGEAGRYHTFEFADEDGWHEVGPGTDYPDREPMGFISQAQEQPPPFEGYVPLPPDQPIGEVLGGPPKTFNPPGEDLSDKKISNFQQ